jgi:hypothetical protein
MSFILLPNGELSGTPDLGEMMNFYWHNDKREYDFITWGLSNALSVKGSSFMPTKGAECRPKGRIPLQRC